MSPAELRADAAVFDEAAARWRTIGNDERAEACEVASDARRSFALYLDNPHRRALAPVTPPAVSP